MWLLLKDVASHMESPDRSEGKWSKRPEPLQPVAIPALFFSVSVNLQLAPLIPRTSWFVLYIWLGEGTRVYIKPVFESKGVAANRSVSVPSPLGLCYPVGLGPVSLYGWV